MSYSLVSPSDVTAVLASFFASAANGPVSIALHEDKAFKANKWLPIGNVTLRPAEDVQQPISSTDALEVAISSGFYDLEVFSFQELILRLDDCLFIQTSERSRNRSERDDGKSNDHKQRQRAAAAIKMLPGVLTRLGLMHPRFDADVITSLPFRSPATVIADTSAVHGGALDFVARFLHPGARIKVPGLVHMEIVNHADGYLQHRRASDTKRKSGEALLSHVKGLGGQRVLLRLELQSDLEVERSSVFADPLRNVFQPDRESEATDLNVTAAVRGYADRLILETARQHRAHSNPGHAVYLMTSDQGLARMSLAEGLRPMFFSVMDAETVFPTTLSGVNFKPFDGSLYSVPLASVLWELASSFGAVRLTTSSNMAVEVCAIGRNLPWLPFHSSDDLLWVRQIDDVAEDEDLPISEDQESTARVREERLLVLETVGQKSEPTPSVGGYKFSAGGLLSIIGFLRLNGTMTRGQLSSAVKVKPDQLSPYIGFLRAAGLVLFSSQDDTVQKTDILDQAYEAMRSRDFRIVALTFLRVPNFATFIDTLAERRYVPPAELKDSAYWRYPNYRRLSEACGLMLLLPDHGLYATRNDPGLMEFCDLAMVAYEGLRADVDQKEEYVLAGAWLEKLAAEFAVHPLVARDRLQQAHSARLIQLFTRGATPDMRFEDRTFHVFEPAGDDVTLKAVHLYHGDFLLPERTSVELRLIRAPA